MTVHEIDTWIDIDASPDLVWRILMNFSAYPYWNPFIYRIEGEAMKGERLSLLIQPPGKREMRFRPWVQNVERQRAFSWLGRLLIPGLFDGHHEFLLEPIAHGTRPGTRFRQRERFSGILVPLVWNGLQPTIRAGFESMNRAIKMRAESTMKE
jgi:hypothetical protein